MTRYKMAHAINKSSITSENASIIRSMLCMRPNVQDNKYNGGKTPDPILFYIVSDNIVYLPYMFSASLFRIIPNINIPYPVTELKFTGTLRDYQISIEAEAWVQLNQYGTSTLCLPPGRGKTILGAKLSSRTRLLTCVLVHREILTGQWKNTYEANTNAKVWIVGEKNPPAKCDVIICMDTRWMQIPESMRRLLGFLIIDESHAFCTPTHVSCLLSFTPKYILLESASLERDDEMHNMMYAVAGSHGVYRESNIPFNVVKVITNIKPERKQNRMGGVDWSSLVSTTLMNPMRNKIIIDAVIANCSKKILILTSLKDHAVILHQLVDKTGISCDYLCGTKRGYIDSNVLVGTISKIGTGFDPATSCPTYTGRPFDLLLLVCSIKKYSMLIQNVGRVFRSEFPTVMHFVDDDDIYKNHWYKARKWYIARGGNITEQSIPIQEGTRTTIVLNTQNANLSWVQNKIKRLNIT